MGIQVATDGEDGGELDRIGTVISPDAYSAGRGRCATATSTG